MPLITLECNFRLRRYRMRAFVLFAKAAAYIGKDLGGLSMNGKKISTVSATLSVDVKAS